MNFNLIASTYRHREFDAQSELKSVLISLGDCEPTSQITNLSGVLTAQTNLDPFHVVRRVKELIHEEPWSIRFILRLIPIEIAFVGADIDSIREAVKRLSPKMQSSDTFRITVEKRDTTMRTCELISKIGSAFDNPVNLDNPQWMVLVEIVGKLIGVSILRPNDIFSLIRESRCGI
jgi:tRNA acetyltransferase TAN1